MSINISAKQVEPLRVNYSHISRRIGDKKPASRYQEAVYDIQPTENFHYPPTWDPERELFDKERTAIKMEDWYSFMDPRQYYYTSYVSARAKQQEVMENNFSMAEKYLLSSLPENIRNEIRSVLIPLRHYEYGANLNNQDICDNGYGASITSLASFNGLDRIGMSQYITRIALLLDENEETTIERAKEDWLESPVWSELRHAMEDSFVLDDWFEQLVAQNIVMDGLVFPLIYQHFVENKAVEGGNLLVMLTQLMNEWYQETIRWTNQLVKVTAAESSANTDLLNQWVNKWLPRLEVALKPLAIRALGESGPETLAEIRSELAARLNKNGLSV